MSETRSLHVLIAGGGLAGLALAQGLLKSGHTVEVFERDADLNRKQGYYLHFNAIGGEALRRVLPSDLFELYLDTSRESYDRAVSIVLDPGFNEITSNPHMGPPNVGPRNHTGVHRRTLRQILSGRLGKQLHIGAPVVSYVEDADGVTATLADGSTAHGDVLVGADGIRSAVRSQLLPQVPVIATGVRGIGVFGRTPLTPELDALMPDILNQGVLMAVDRSGSRLLVATFRPRRPAAEAAKDIAPDIELDDVPAYVMISCSVMPGTVVPPASEWTPDTAGILQESMLEAVADLASRGTSARPRPRPRLGLRDPVRVPRAGRELGAFAGHHRGRRRTRHAADARHGRQPRTQRRGAADRAARPLRPWRGRLARGDRHLRGADARDHVPDPAHDARPRQELRRRRSPKGDQAADENSRGGESAR